MDGFDNMALCLHGGKLVGGLAFTTDFQKNPLLFILKWQYSFYKNNRVFQFLQDSITYWNADDGLLVD